MSKHRVHRGAGRRRVTVSAAGALVGLGTVAAVVPAAPAALAAPAPAPAAAAPAGNAPSSVPCAAEVKACARLSTNQAWLTDGRGNLLRGPITIDHGAPGNETPTGRFSVQWKDADHRSGEYNGAPMPWSVFFDGNGRAFHGGSPGSQTAGCVRLPDDQAKAFFDALAPGDAVQILP